MIILPTEKRFDWNNPPITLLLIILLNVLVFFFYQFGDDLKLSTAVSIYQQERLFDIEWPEYQRYLKYNKRDEQLIEYQTLSRDGETGLLMLYILYDQPFYEHLKKNGGSIFTENDLGGWQAVREHVTNIISSTSSLRYGLVPNRLDVFNLISHQFLHGGLMHLLGNMFFLIVCGFAVEASIGHSRFLLFYLLSGVAGGLLHASTDLQSFTPLVGASGSISGVMAMYLFIFRMRKIEFFYWFYVFVGYFRAPALLILPFYIGKELFSYFSPGEANIAYLAHAGGFIVGALQIGLLIQLKPGLLNDDYIEKDQSIDPKQQKLAAIYQALEKLRFSRALGRLTEYLEQNPDEFELQRLKHELLCLLNEQELDDHVLQILSMKHLTEQELNQQQQIFKEYAYLHSQIDDAELSRLGISYCKLEDIATAESIFNQLHEKHSDSDMLGVFARKLSIFYQGKENQKKQQHYEILAENYLSRNLNA